VFKQQISWPIHTLFTCPEVKRTDKGAGSINKLMRKMGEGGTVQKKEKTVRGLIDLNDRGESNLLQGKLKFKNGIRNGTHLRTGKPRDHVPKRRRKCIGEVSQQKIRKEKYAGR